MQRNGWHRSVWFAAWLSACGGDVTPEEPATTPSEPTTDLVTADEVCDVRLAMVEDCIPELQGGTGCVSSLSECTQRDLGVLHEYYSCLLQDCGSEDCFPIFDRISQACENRMASD